mmetsp:Transcript_68809/g.222362  ORF Transcript_68809/g.222362 Transcript_68809/m.222362 type:complete len:228 (+) Transcript_68809:271-954(+)
MLQPAVENDKLARLVLVHVGRCLQRLSCCWLGVDRALPRPELQAPDGPRQLTQRGKACEGAPSRYASMAHIGVPERLLVFECRALHNDERRRIQHQIFISIVNLAESIQQLGLRGKLVEQRQRLLVVGPEPAHAVRDGRLVHNEARSAAGSRDLAAHEIALGRVFEQLIYVGHVPPCLQHVGHGVLLIGQPPDSARLQLLHACARLPALAWNLRGAIHHCACGRPPR